MSAFVPFQLEGGTLLQLDRLRVVGWNGTAELPEGTACGLVTAPTELQLGPDRFTLRAGAYFVAPEPVRIFSGRGLAIVVPGYRGLRQVGGPIEPTGRLKYIDTAGRIEKFQNKFAAGSYASLAAKKKKPVKPQTES